MPNKFFIKQALDEYASLGEPEDADLWPSILMHIRTESYFRDAAMQRAEEANDAASSGGRGTAAKRPAARLSLVSAGVLLLVIVGVGTLVLRQWGRPSDLPVVGYTGAPTNSTTSDSTQGSTGSTGNSADGMVFDFDAGDSLKHVNSLGTPLNITRSIGAYSVTLHRAYADANHIVVEYSVQGPTGENIAAVDTALTDGKDMHFSQLFGMKGAPGTAPGTYAVGFDASTLDRLPEQLKLSLSLSLVKVDPNGVEPPVLPNVAGEAGNWTLVERNVITGASGAPGTGSWSDLWEKAAGPFTIDFTVPVTQASTRFAEVNQTVQAGGVTMTLDRVVVTPGETRVFLTFDAGSGDRPVWTPSISLQAGDYASGTGQAFTEITRSTSSGKWSYSLFEDLTGQQGEWALTVSELKSGTDFALRDGVIQRGNQAKAITGPWVFKFTVPPAAKP